MESWILVNARSDERNQQLVRTRNAAEAATAAASNVNDPMARVTLLVSGALEKKGRL